MSACLNSSPTVEDASITFTVEWDSTYEGDGWTSNSIRNETTATGTNFATQSTKFNDNPKTKWYDYEKVCSPKNEKPAPIFYYEPLQPWEEGYQAPARVRPQHNIRDNRSAVWACRPRHGLSGR